MIKEKKLYSRQEGMFGTIFKAGFLNLFIGAIILVIDTVFEFPAWNIKQAFLILIFSILVIIYVGILIWSTIILIIAKKKDRIAITGPYAFCRHPMYAGIVLLVNPGLAIFLESWPLLFACLIFYFIWKYYAELEEKKLISYFGKEYREYSQRIGCFFPKI